MPFEGEKFKTPPISPEEEPPEGETEKELVEGEEIMEEVFKETQEIELDKGIEAINDDLKEIVSERKEEGYEVEENGHIDFLAFKNERGRHFGYYSPTLIEEDRKFVERKEKEWKEEKESQKRKGEKWYQEWLKKERDGELLERYITVIFDEFLGEKFDVLRTSRLDDYKNHVDTLLLDKETGIPLCAFDEVADTSGPRFEKKKEEILKKNLEGGVFIKYGYRIEKGKISPDSLSNIPVFYLAMDKWSLRDSIKKDSPATRRGAFSGLSFAMKKQIEVLREKLSSISPVRKKLESIEKKLLEKKG